MRGAARALAWEFQRHHRLGLVVFALYLVSFWIIKGWVLGPEAHIRLDPPNGLAGFVIAPFAITFFFFVGTFSYGLGGDIGARESCFPKRMFTLPASSLALAGWPMLYGTVASVSLWALLMLLARWSGGLEYDLPMVWPALLMAVFLAWMQALTWLPYPLRGMRVAVAVLLLTSVDAVVILSIVFQAREAAMIAILAPQLLLAYLVGWYAVTRARRGVVPDWHGLLSWTGADERRQHRAAFSSASRAQLWFEWRRHGRTLPVLVGLVVPWLLLLLFIPGNDTAWIVFAILILALLVPPAMALLAAPALGTFTTFAATRPLTSLALVGAKLEMTLWSTLAAWLVDAVFIAGALFFSGTMHVVIDRLQALAEIAGPLRATIVVLAVLAALVTATWKNLVQSLCIGLTGRPWVIKASALVALALLVAAFPIVFVIVAREKPQAFVWDYLPWILAALVWLKVGVASWVAIGLHDRKVLGDRALVAGAVGWLAAVCVVYGVLAWIAASPIFPFYFLGAIAILAVPLARLSAAPLALDWSRHR